jgi:peptidyl-prolyl cis-trans isomerase D
MLETMRRNSRSAIIYVLFGILIAVFVLSFGPGSRGFVAQNTASNWAAKVNGNTLTEQDFRFAYVARGGTQYSALQAKEARLKESVMDELIAREILATEAAKLGFKVSQKEAEDLVADGQMILLGRHLPLDRYAFKDGKFDYERFKLIAQNQLGVSVLRYLEIEEEEMLADKMRQMLQTGERVSPAEVKAEFEQEGLQVNLDYVRFSSSKYAADDEPSAADVAAYQKAHEADLKKTYEERKPLSYTKVDKQLRLRHMLIDVAKDASPQVVAKAKAQADDAKKKLDGGADFAQLAGEVSTSDASKHHHGELGWRKKGYTGFGEALDGKLFAPGQAKKGTVVGPEKTERGFELVLVEDTREGDISFEQAAPELAEQAFSRDRAKDKARAEAQAALDRAKKGEKLEVMFPPAKDDDAKDKSSRFSQSDAPTFKQTGLFSRRGDSVADIGTSKELAKKAFELPIGELAGPFEVAGAYVIVQVKEHKDPDLKDFDKRKAELTRQAEQGKWFSTAEAYAKDRCVELRDSNRIKVNDELMSYDLPPALAKVFEQAGGKFGYVPCATLGR